MESTAKNTFVAWESKQKNLRGYMYNSFGGNPGFSDRLGYIEAKPWPVPYLIEFKNPDDVRTGLSPKQIVFKRNMQFLGVPILSPCHEAERAINFVKKLIKETEQYVTE